MTIRSNGIEQVQTRPAGIAVRQITSQALNSSSLNFTTTFGEKVKVLSIMAHFSANPTKNNFIVKFNSKDGSNYDTVLRTVDVKDIFDIYHEFDGGSLLLEEGDELTITCGNDNTPISIVYVTVIGETA